MSAVLDARCTRVRFAEHASRVAGRDVWVKLDGETHPRYGGNKVRKLSVLLADARRVGATDLLTLGAAGSHHVLATGTHGRAMGLRTHAALTPQRFTEHAKSTLLATVAQGVSAMAVASVPQALAALAARAAWVRAQGRRPYVITLGGSSPLGALGYVRCVDELAAHVRDGDLPQWPAAVYVPFGSGGTAAGLMLGAARHARGPGFVRCVALVPALDRVAGTLVYALARAAEKALSHDGRREHPLARVEPAPHARAVSRSDAFIVRDFAGAGYGIPSDEGARAQALFARDGVFLDPTYGAKSAAALLAQAASLPKGQPVLLVATVSSAPLEPLQAQRRTLPAALEALLHDGTDR